jgi:DNA repair protein RecN (Recombination protein N)
LAQLRANARHIAQRIDFLNYQVEEISVARLEPAEESDLRSERARLGNVEQLLTDAAEAIDLLEGSGEESPAVIDSLGQAERAISRLSRLDPTQAPLLETLQGVTFQLSDLSATLRDYQDTLEFNPERLDEVEERLELINRLKRKYGDDIPAILETLRKAEEELDGISHSEERQKLLEKQEHEFLVRIGEMAAALSQKRKAVAEHMAAAVVVELDQLRMAGSRFAVDFHVVENEDGVFIDGKRLAIDASGVDRAEFLISANPGEPLKPMVKVASGGETARLMLALKTVLAQVDKTPTLIFDEIDQGIGGRVGITVGEKLWGLTQHGGHQVIVVTHLPQMAGFGDVHMQVSKAVDEGRTVTLVNTLDEAGRIEELAAMLGTREDEARRGAASILHQANERKKEPVGV